MLHNVAVICGVPEVMFNVVSCKYRIKKRQGLQTIQSLAKHHSDILKTKLHEVCLVLIEEVLHTLCFLYVFHAVTFPSRAYYSLN